MRLYIAGPMSGLPEFNYPAFREAEAVLRALGYAVESPHHNGETDCGTVYSWDWYMRRAIAQLITCNGVALLPGWEMSRGATLEHLIARGLDMPTKPMFDWELEARIKVSA